MKILLQRSDGLTVWRLLAVWLLGGGAAGAAGPPAEGRGTFERGLVEPQDVAAALGLSISRFHFEFAEPVCEELRLEVRRPAEKPVTVYFSVGTVPSRGHDVTFSVTDRATLCRAAGLPRPEPTRHLLFSAQGSDAGFEQEMEDIFDSPDPEAGYSRHYSMLKDRSDVPLDVPIVLEIKAGGLGKAPFEAMTNVREQFATAPAYYRLLVRFFRPKQDDAAGAPESGPARPVFPLKVADSRRFLQDAAGHPFFYLADTAWQMLRRLDDAEMKRYLDKRKEQGFSAIQVQLLPEGWTDADTDPAGQPLLLAPGDLSQPNPAYFDRAASLLRAADRRGLLVTLSPAWLGCCEGGWRDRLKANGTAKCRAYGEWLGKRFRDHPNVLWLNGGDRDPGEWSAEVAAIAEGIATGAPAQLQTAHPASTHTAAEAFGRPDWLKVNTIYDYFAGKAGGWTKGFHVYRHAKAAAAAEPPMPFFLVESTYEGEHKSTPQTIRRQAWWALLGGACGQAIGNGRIWRMEPGWESHLDTPASRDMQALSDFFTRRAWWTLRPDHDRSALTGGTGSFNETSEPGGDDFAAAAVSADRSLFVAYFPTTRDIQLAPDIAALRLLWFDPTSAQVQPAASLTMPGRNAGGDFDWVLVGEKSSR